MVRRRVQGGLLLVLSHLILTASVLAGTPKLARVLPRGARVGTEVEVLLGGDHLRETIDLLFAGPGIELVSIEETKDKSARVRLRIAPDCPLGLHALRVRTRTGLSNLRTISIGALEEILEAKDNDTVATAQEVPLDCTLVGIASSEDVDYYTFEGKQGERVSAEIEGLRLGSTLFDPSIAILDERGFELAGCDDDPFLRQDACLSLRLPADGRYFLRVRECSYRGNADCHYRLHLGRFPRPLALFPAGGASGANLEVRAIGDELSDTPLTIQLADKAAPIAPGSGWTLAGVQPVYIQDEHGRAPSPNWIRVTDLESLPEVEPNGSTKTATPCMVPGAVDGIIAEPGDRDRFRFEAKKGEQFHVVVLARSLRSPLDPFLRIYDAKGKQLKANDDTIGPDSYILFKVPKDGTYTLDVRDQLGAGGPQFVYRLEAHRVEPQLQVQAPRERQTLAVPRGGRAVLMLTTQRGDCNDAFEALLSELPAGVAAEKITVARGVDKFPVLLTAASDAALGQAQVPVTLRLLDKEGQPTRPVKGGFRQDVELVLGKNRTVFWAHSIDRLPVAVVQAAPFAIEVLPLTAPLVQNGSTLLRVQLTRAEGFKGKVKLRVPFTPPGVKARQNLWIEADKTVVEIPVEARGNARIGDWILVVEAEGYPGQGVLRIASGPVPITVAAPFVSFTAQATSVERGEATALHLEIKKLEGFRGTAVVRLGGLPHHVSAEPLTLDESTESLDFEILTQDDSPLGRQKQLFCTAEFQTESGSVMHRLPAAELLINAPPKNPVAVAPKPKPKKKEAKQAAPLSRLEKLRLEHERAAAARSSTRAAATEAGEAAAGTSTESESPANKEGS